MQYLRAVKYVLHRRRKYKQLILPVVFFFTELALALTLLWGLFGVNYSGFDRKLEASNYAQSPLVAVKAFHSSHITAPYGKYTSDVAAINVTKKDKVMKAVCYGVSLIWSLIGIFIAMLWINNFFGKNKLNIRWWMWPATCWGAHLVLFIIAGNI